MKTPANASLRTANRSFQTAAGFSLIELLITLAIIAILFSIMMPTFSIVRNSAQKLMCMNNMRAIHYGIQGYAGNNSRRFPLSQHAFENRYQQTMAMSAIKNPLVDLGQEWDGLGRLKQEGYLDDCKCLYCASHHGLHPYEDYESDFVSEKQVPTAGNRLIFTNYQYFDRKPSSSQNPFRLDSVGQETIVVSDGLRTKSDFNHTTGGNALRGDGHIAWFGTKSLGYNLQLLPEDQTEIAKTTEQVKLFSGIWTSIQLDVNK